MGGYGSSRWKDHDKAIMVEDCLALDTTSFRKNWRVNQPDTRGTLSWQDGNRQTQSSASYSLTRGAGQATLKLLYFSTPPRTEMINLVPTRPYYGGKRWWFICPACGGRARKLFLPPGGSSFRCRPCYGLTYRSSVERKTTWETIRRLRRMGLFPNRGLQPPLTVFYRLRNRDNLEASAQQCLQNLQNQKWLRLVQVNESGGAQIQRADSQRTKNASNRC